MDERNEHRTLKWFWYQMMKISQRMHSKVGETDRLWIEWSIKGMVDRWFFSIRLRKIQILARFVLVREGNPTTSEQDSAYADHSSSITMFQITKYSNFIKKVEWIKHYNIWPLYYRLWIEINILIKPRDYKALKTMKTWRANSSSAPKCQKPISKEPHIKQKEKLIIFKG